MMPSEQAIASLLWCQTCWKPETACNCSRETREWVQTYPDQPAGDPVPVQEQQ